MHSFNYNRFSLPNLTPLFLNIKDINAINLFALRRQNSLLKSF